MLLCINVEDDNVVAELLMLKVPLTVTDGADTRLGAISGAVETVPTRFECDICDV